MTHQIQSRTWVTRHEWLLVSLFALVIMILTSVPYAIGYMNQTPEQQYSGFILAAEDGFSYIGKMRLGVEGHWRFHIFYTTEPHEAVPLTFLPYIIPGQIIRLFTDTANPNLFTIMTLTFHAMRIVFGMLAIMAIYRFIAMFLEPIANRFIALVLAVLGGGFGVLLIFSGATPPEWFIPEAFTFTVLLAFPHLALARAAMLIGFLLLYASFKRRTLAFAAAAAWIITALSVPFYLVVIYALVGIWGLLLWLRERRFPITLFWRALIAAGLTLPLFGFYLWIFNRNPVMAQWSAQNILISPPPTHYLLAYGPVLLFGVFAVRRAWRQSGFYLLLLAWVIVGLGMIYLPINVQRRLGEGVFVSLSVLAIMGIHVIVETLSKNNPDRQPRISFSSRVLLLVLVLPANLLLLFFSAVNVANRFPDLYTEGDVIEAFLWLDTLAPDSERGLAILAPNDVGNRLPAYTHHRPFVGHGPETLNATEKRELVLDYYSDRLSTDERQALYNDYQIDYVLFLQDESPVPDWSANDMTERFRNDGVVIFEVMR